MIRKNYDSRKSEPFVTVESNVVETVKGAQQHFKDECDINKTMARVLRGENVEMREGGVYGDFTKFPTDLHQMRQYVEQCDEQFAELPAATRARFKNRPEELIRFLENPENRKEAEDLGLVKKQERKEQPKVGEKVEAPSPT